MQAMHKFITSRRGTKVKTVLSQSHLLQLWTTNVFSVESKDKHIMRYKWYKHRSFITKVREENITPMIKLLNCFHLPTLISFMPKTCHFDICTP